MAARAATSRSALAMPMATPTAKMIGRLPKIVLPALAMMVSRPPRSVPSPKMASRPYVLMVVGLVNDAPMPSRIPAIGSTATGSMKLRPTRCNTLKISSFMRPSFPPRAGTQKGISKKQLYRSPSSKRDLLLFADACMTSNTRTLLQHILFQQALLYAIFIAL